MQNRANLPQSRLAADTDYDQFAIVGRRSLAVIPDPSAPPAPRGDCFWPLDTSPFAIRAACLLNSSQRSFRMNGILAALFL